VLGGETKSGRDVRGCALLMHMDVLATGIGLQVARGEGTSALHLCTWMCSRSEIGQRVGASGKDPTRDSTRHMKVPAAALRLTQDELVLGARREEITLSLDAPAGGYGPDSP